MEETGLSESPPVLAEAAPQQAPAPANHHAKQEYDIIAEFKFVGGVLHGGFIGSALLPNLVPTSVHHIDQLALAPLLATAAAQRLEVEAEGPVPVVSAALWTGYDVGHIPEAIAKRKSYKCRLCGKVKLGHTCSGGVATSSSK